MPSGGDVPPSPWPAKGVVDGLGTSLHLFVHLDAGGWSPQPPRSTAGRATTVPRLSRSSIRSSPEPPALAGRCARAGGEARQAVGPEIDAAGGLGDRLQPDLQRVAVGAGDVEHENGGAGGVESPHGGGVGGRHPHAVASETAEAPAEVDQRLLPRQRRQRPGGELQGALRRGGTAGGGKVEVAGGGGGAAPGGSRGCGRGRSGPLMRVGFRSAWTKKTISLPVGRGSASVTSAPLTE